MTHLAGVFHRALIHATLKALLAFVPSAFSLHANSSNLTEVKSFGPDPGNLRMFVHAPNGAEGLRPLVVVLHGCTQKARRIAALSGWNDLADTAGCYVVYVQQRTINNSLRCFNWFREQDIKPGEGEVGSVASMVRHALAHYPIDPARVYLYGVSSGGALSSALAACEPDLFAGVGIFAGAPYRAANNTLDARLVIRNPRVLDPAQWGRMVTDLHPQRTKPYPPVIVVHGTNDGVVDMGHGQALVAQWTAVAKTDSVPDRVEEPYQGNTAVRRSEYHTSDGGVVVVFYKVQGLGHQLPIDPGEGKRHGGKRSWVSRDLDFHSTYVLAKEWGLVE